MLFIVPSQRGVVRSVIILVVILGTAVKLNMIYLNRCNDDCVVLSPDTLLNPFWRNRSGTETVQVRPDAHLEINENS